MFCRASRAKYECPRCQAPYCSLRCYRSRGHLDCSESFYEEAVKTELSVAGGGGDEAKKKMVEALKRDHDDGEEEEAVDSDDEDDLCDRLDGVDLDGDPDELWSRLTAEERADFERLVASGEIADMLPEFRPWWEWEGADSKVVEVDKECLPPDMPEIVDPIVPLPKSFRASPNVRYGLANALYAYAYGIRYFRGDLSEDPLHFCSMLFDLSAGLSPSAANFDSFDLALESAAQAVNVTARWAVSAQTTRGAKRDVVAIVKGCLSANRDAFLLAALSHIKRSIRAAIRELRAKKSSDVKGEPDLSKDSLPPWKRQERARDANVDSAALKKAEKKIEFYLSWVLANGDELDVLRA